jgi:hypothetical protein
MSKRGAPEVPASPVGKAAFQAHLNSLSARIRVGDDSEASRAAASALSKAKQWCDAGDFLAAVHAVGGLEVQINGTPGGSAAHVKAGDVEQALGDLRREVGRVGEQRGAVEAARLWEAAREEVIGGAWEAALALIGEARNWLKQGHP